MTETIARAQKLSRETEPELLNLKPLLEAEEQIGAMPDDDVMELQQQLAAAPSDPFLYLWLGLAAGRRGQWQAAIDAFGHAIDQGCTHWRVGWYIAQAAKSAGQLAVLDDACAAVLAANPKFWFARELPKHARGYYSQIGQDKVVEQFFSKIAPRTKTFVEVGAFDGVHYSNVRRLQEQYGWTGISFEPVSKNFRKLCAAYAGRPVKCVQSAVSTADAELEINVSTYPHLPDWGSDVATLGEADTERWEREYGATWTKEKVPVRRLTRLLDEAGIADFDFISIDTEGHDLEVLKSIDFKRYHPLLIVIEYGANKAGIAEILQREGYGVLQDNGMDFIACPKALPRRGEPAPAPTAMRRTAPSKKSQPEATTSAATNAPQFPEVEIAPADLPPYLARLNPHLVALGTLPRDRTTRLASVPPLELLTPERFDLPAKIFYAQHRERGVESAFARELYHAHIAAFSGGTCQEGDGRKHGIDDYFSAFEELLDDVKTRGFDAQLSLVPVARNGVAIDGGHRIAAGIVHGRPVPVLQFDCPTNSFGFDFFRQRGLDEKWLDAMALEYCRQRPDTFVAAVFPSAVGKEAEIRALLNRHGRLVYAKEVVLNRRGARNLICELYAGEPWLGDWRNNFAGADGKMEPCFRGDGPVRVYVFQAADLEAVRQAKVAIRDLFGLANHSVHINDTHAQTLQLGRLFLNANSIHFLNHAERRYFERFVRHLARYRSWLTASGHDPEHFCIDGSAVMAAYGLREAQDLDVLHFDEADFSAVMPEVNSHNPDAHHHTTTRDDIVFNPANHFHAFGLKFASLDVIRRLKAKRNEGKDQRDVLLIDGCQGATSAQTTTAGGMQKHAPKIVGLIPARNEAQRLPFCLRALRPHVDAIVYLDDCSDDDSVRVVESLAAECCVEHIIRKTHWHRDEPGDRNALLAAGRRIGGTHFIVLDADEAFTANCERDGYLRRLVLSLRVGETLSLSWIQLWRSVGQYRFDQSPWTYATKAFAFCDDGVAAYQSGFIHTQRVPQGLAGRAVSVVNYVHGVMHFQFVNWANLQIKQAWYRCMENIRDPQRSLSEINAQYAPSEDESGLALADVPADWLDGYAGLDASVFAARDERRIREILGWFRTHGVRRFAGLDIWRVDWAALTDDAELAAEIRRQAGSTAVATAPLSAAGRQHMAAASQHLARGDLAACCAAVERALAEAPGNPEILCALGNLHFTGGRPAEARQCFLGSLASQPHQPALWAQLAAIERQLENTTGFISALQRALEQDADCIEALSLQAEVHEEYGQLADATGVCRRLVQLLPGDVNVRANLARVLFAGGEADEARTVCEQALKLDPSHAATREVLAALASSPQREQPELAGAGAN